MNCRPLPVYAVTCIITMNDCGLFLMRWLCVVHATCLNPNSIFNSRTPLWSYEVKQPGMSRSCPVTSDEYYRSEIESRLQNYVKKNKVHALIPHFLGFFIHLSSYKI
jgi:hypothetical protein